MHQILILGNGFDLSCGLKSSYSDFFEDRYCNLNSILCKNTDKVSFKEIDFINLTYPIMEQNVDPICKLKEVLHINDLTFWDLIFLIAKDCVDLQIDAYKWQDVETVIFDVISISLGFEEDCKMPYVKSNRVTSDGKIAFSKIIFKLLQDNNDSLEQIANYLLSQLKKFESIFSKYIDSMIDLEKTNEGYVNNAIELYQKLSNGNELKNVNYETDRIDVFSFNYSLDSLFVNILDKNIDDLRLKSWTNIHGIAHKIETPYFPAPIFGIDNHDIDKYNDKDMRMLFTKQFRVLENDTNIINDDRQSDNFEQVDLITIYGHSLGRADYSYFETIFDECDLYNSNIKIEYYFYPKDENSKIEATKKIFYLLSLYGDSIGKNIVTRLIIENRISIIPMTSI